MIRQVYKRHLNMDDQGTLIPGTPLYVESQRGQWCCWYVKGDDEPEFVVQVFGTGHDINDPRFKHLGSFMEMEGNLVWHAFYRRVVMPNAH